MYFSWVSQDLFFDDPQGPQLKSSTNGKPLTKEENKIQNPAKKGITNTAVDDSNKSAKQRLSVNKWSSETINGLNLANFVKVAPTNRKWTDGSVSWAPLPSPLARLGKVCLMYHEVSSLFKWSRIEIFCLSFSSLKTFLLSSIIIVESISCRLCCPLLKVFILFS